MGSSASVAVAIARAVAAATGRSLSDDEIVAAAMAGETILHGTPSGIDPTVIAMDRPVFFEIGAEVEVVEPAPGLALVVGDTGEATATREMVSRVAARRAGSRASVDRWFAQIGGLVRDARQLMTRGGWSRLGRTLDSNHLILQALGVSTSELDHLVAEARGAGALGAKMSGAGGGGVIVALVAPDDIAAVEQALLGAGATAVYRAGLAVHA
jgi:mevalonate kinase